MTDVYFEHYYTIWDSHGYGYKIGPCPENPDYAITISYHEESLDKPSITDMSFSLDQVKVLIKALTGVLEK